MKKSVYVCAIACSMALTAVAEPSNGAASRASESDAEWVTLEGNAKYTDAFTDVFAAAGEEKVYETLEVAVQQDANDASHYRLVNPYKNWSNPYSCAVTYDDANDYYLEFYVLEDAGKAYITRFETGLSLDGKGTFGVESDVNYYSPYYTATYMLANFPGAFGDFADGVFTYQATYELEGYTFATINGWYGEYNPYGSVFAVNATGNFKIELPSASGSVTSITVEAVGRTEYFDLNGRRVTNPQDGLYIKVERLNSGKIRSTKVIL